MSLAPSLCALFIANDLLGFPARVFRRPGPGDREARPVGRMCARGAGTRRGRVPEPERAGRGGAESGGPGRHHPHLGSRTAAGAREPGGPGLRAPLARPPAAGRLEPASLSRCPAVMVADQRLPRVPAEPGTIPRFCALLLGAGETKRKCQEHVNQTRYSVTITSLSGLPGPEHPGAPRAQARHLRGALAPALGAGGSLRLCSPAVGAWARGRKEVLGALPARAPLAGP